MENQATAWADMTPEQKRASRLEEFRNSGAAITFVSEAAKKAYEVRVQRLVDVYNVKEPDRVPTSIMAGNLPLTMSGLDMYSAFQEPDKANAACMKFNEPYAEKIESFSLAMAMSGEALAILDYKLYSWPGHGLPRTSPGWQFREGEYMTADEYDDLIRDPSDFRLRKYLPRALGSFDGFRYFQSFTNIVENVHVAGLMPLAMPPVREMLKKLLEAGEALERNSSEMFQFMTMGAARGFPTTFGGFCKAPFDTLGDTLRGTVNIMKDMFQRPEKLLKALDVVADITIANVLNTPGIEHSLVINYPLHKGADGWMSQAQWDKFYWPTLKRVMDALINEGLIQSLFAEGSYSTRLDHVNQFPKGSVVWWFDRTDMAEAKRILGKDCAIMGNVPSSMLVTSGPAEVKAYCRNLIETCGKDGGEEVRVNARADIVASGGYANNAEWIKKYTGLDLGVNLTPIGNEGKLGDGIRMAHQVGAAEEGIEVIEMLRTGKEQPGTMTQTGFAVVQPDLRINNRGERFTDETVTFDDTSMGNASIKQGGTGFSILDTSIVRILMEGGIEKAMALDFPPGSRLPNLQKELDDAPVNRPTEVYQADSIAELATLIDIEPATLQATIDEYNRFCEQRHDELFAKDPRYLRPIRGPRFHAVRTETVFPGTMGGIKVNHNTQVVDESDAAIPGLYAGGFDAGGMYGDSYCIKYSTGLCSSFAVNPGRLAGKNALGYLSHA